MLSIIFVATFSFIVFLVKFSINFELISRYSDRLLASKLLYRLNIFMIFILYFSVAIANHNIIELMIHLKSLFFGIYFCSDSFNFSIKYSFYFYTQHHKMMESILGIRSLCNMSK